MLNHAFLPRLQSAIEKLATEASNARQAYVAMGHMERGGDDLDGGEGAPQQRRGTFMVGELLKKAHKEKDDKAAAKHGAFLSRIADRAKAALGADSVETYVACSREAAAAGVDLGLDFFVGPAPPGLEAGSAAALDEEEHRRAKLGTGIVKSSGEVARLHANIVLAALDVETCLRSRDLWIAHARTTFDVAPSLLAIARDARDALALAREAQDKASKASAWREELQAMEAALDRRLAVVSEAVAGLKEGLDAEAEARAEAEAKAKRDREDAEAKKALEDAERARLAEDEAKRALELEEQAEAGRRASIEAAKLASLLGAPRDTTKNDKEAAAPAPADDRSAGDIANAAALWEALEAKADKVALARLRLEVRQLAAQMAGDGAMAITQKRSFSAKFAGALGARAREGYTLRDGMEICLSCHRPATSPRRPSTPSLEKVDVERKLQRHAGAPSGRSRPVVRPKSASAGRAPHAKTASLGLDLDHMLRSASGTLALNDPHVAAQFGPTGAYDGFKHPGSRRPKTAQGDRTQGGGHHELKGRNWPRDDERLDGTYAAGRDPHDAVHRFNENGYYNSRKVMMPRTTGDVTLKSATLGFGANQAAFGVSSATPPPASVQFSPAPPMTSLQHSPGFTPSPIHRDNAPPSRFS